MAETAHIGRKISRIRELRGMKQEALATELGISQQAVSKIEQSAEVEDSALEKIAKALGITKDAIKNFNEEGVINYFNTFNDHSFNNGAYNAFGCTFNPIEKWLEVVEENRKVYGGLLASEEERVQILKGQK